VYHFNAFMLIFQRYSCHKDSKTQLLCYNKIVDIIQFFFYILVILCVEMGLRIIQNLILF
jgi:hypothetical protein